MSRYVFKLPDLGEGTVSAEIVSWHVKPGDDVSEDDVLVEVMTEKAAVEVPAPVTGKIVSTTGQPGDTVAVGAELVVLETAAAGAAAAGTSAQPAGAPGNGGRAPAGHEAPPPGKGAGQGAPEKGTGQGVPQKAAIENGAAERSGAGAAMGNGAARQVASGGANG
ncbi:MAG TPA: biotin/lipoyl-containing protein, partial [Steroidobacteraceae bacterium]|nr:biotin/lipoyl-containing protein [Steroidobacteraceae bacterium]